MADVLTRKKRSLAMARIRSTGNASTELRALKQFRIRGVKHWRRHSEKIIGRPDFYFPRARLALFIDGCFWHACPRCGHIPKSNIEYWESKIGRNRRRDLQTGRRLRRRGYLTMRVWEHELRDLKWLGRLQRRLSEGESASESRVRLYPRRTTLVCAKTKKA